MSVALSWLVPYKLGVAALNECYRLTFPMLMPVALWLILSTLARSESEEKGSAFLLPLVLVLGLLLALNGKWPLFQGSKALEKYLTDLGFKYIIASDFDNAMLFYTRKFHKENRHSEWFIKEVHDKYFLDFMDAVDAIAKNRRVVATAANLRLIELNPP